MDDSQKSDMIPRDRLAKIQAEISAHKKVGNGVTSLLPVNGFREALKPVAHNRMFPVIKVSGTFPDGNAIRKASLHVRRFQSTREAVCLTLRPDLRQRGLGRRRRGRGGIHEEAQVGHGAAVVGGAHIGVQPITAAARGQFHVSTFVRRVDNCIGEPC